MLHSTSGQLYLWVFLVFSLASYSSPRCARGASWTINFLSFLPFLLPFPALQASIPDSGAKRITSFAKLTPLPQIWADPPLESITCRARTTLGLEWSPSGRTGMTPRILWDRGVAQGTHLVSQEASFSTTRQLLEMLEYLSTVRKLCSVWNKNTRVWQRYSQRYRGTLKVQSPPSVAL